MFDIVAVSETRFSKKSSLTSKINLQNDAFEFTGTESNAEKTLIYIANHLSYKPCAEFSLKIIQLESTFT